MKKLWKRGLSFILAAIMVAGLFPTAAFAAVDSTGRPKDVNNALVLSIYSGTGFPGEPAVYGTSDYKNFNSKFEVSRGATFASSANQQLDWNKIQNSLVQGTSSGSTSVWGVYDANGTKDYFLSTASIVQPANEAKIIRAIKTDVAGQSDEAVLAKYEVVWYVIKLQHSSGWFGSGTTEWHIDGVVKEKTFFSVNYYGNGNTSGNAPLGTTTHPSNQDYTVLDKNTLAKRVNGADVAFLGWSARADGTGAELAFYQPGDVITAAELQNLGGKLSLYAMWDTTTQHTATVRTYLDGNLFDADDIHDGHRDLQLSTDGEHFHPLTQSGEGVYTAKITGNGKFHLYNKNDDGTYSQIGTYQITIYNQDGSLDIHHYSVTYDPNGGSFASAPHDEVYFAGNPVDAIADVPVREGYRFLGWKDNDGKLIQPGEEVTAAIEKPVTLTAQWEKTVNVTINVTINHKGGDGYNNDDSKDDVALSLVSRENAERPYLEVAGKNLQLSETSHEGFEYSGSKETTTYTGYTCTDMPGGEVDYTVATSKSGYDTEVNAVQDAEGNWVIDVIMTFNPDDFDLTFTVEVDESVPDEYIPTAVIVKIVCWMEDDQVWQTISQQEGYLPGVRVDIDPETRSGSGTYPVWIANQETPYGYRVRVSSFVYPDGTIARASTVVEQDVAWSDNVYTATLDDVTGGKAFGTLNGAYFDADAQQGQLNAVISMELYNVTFDANGGLVNGNAAQTVEKQYKIPGFNDYVATREGGYIFAGWYEDQACTRAATEGADLTEDITLYAKWIEPLTISGTVTISGTYMLDGKEVSVHDIDRATEAAVVLQEINNGTVYDVDSQTVFFGNYEGTGSAAYSFTGIPNDGKTYQIHVLEPNYTTTYDNESDADTKVDSTEEYAAVFGDDNVAKVDAKLTFDPAHYTQNMVVDASQIGDGFRPESVLAKVLYRDTGDIHPFNTISQHGEDSPAPHGVQIALDKATGIGTGSEEIWKWHTDGTLYEYQMDVTEVDSAVFDSDADPFYIVYNAPTHWDEAANAPTNDLKATLIPKSYPVTFNLNAGTDTVTGMDAYKVQESYTDEAGSVVTFYTYQTKHTWSFDTAITAVPVREGYTFKGWTAEVETAYADGKIAASVHEAVVLTAQWEQVTYTITTAAEPAEGGSTSGDGTYALGTDVTVTAAANTDYLFEGWYENDEKVSELAEYTFAVTGDRALTAKFTAIPPVVTYTIQTSADPEEGGTVSGAGTYTAETEIVVKAEAADGYAFGGWYENNKKVSVNAEYAFAVTGNRTLVAKFSKLPEVSYENAYAYIFGYNNTTMGAEGPLLRSEASVMVYRLVKQNNELGDFVYDAANPSFTDIKGEWFQSGIEYIHHKGGFRAAEGTHVGPYAQVTRGEVFKIVALGLGFTENTTLTYDEYGAILAGYGYIKGENDSGWLNSEGWITRAQFCTMYNRIIGRADALLVDRYGNQITAETYGFTDLDPNAWYYADMLRATSAYDENGYVDIALRAVRNVVDDYS